MSKTGTREHPCPYPPAVLACMRRHLADVTGLVLDPMAGEGGVHLLSRPDLRAIGIDIEQWEQIDGAWVIHGDAREARHLVGVALNIVDAHLRGRAKWQAVVVSPGYGNRLRDKLRHDRTADTVLSYAQRLGADLSPGNGCALAFNDEYRLLHRTVWAEAIAGLEPGGRFILNIKDHFKTREATKTRAKAQTRERVTAWHIATLLDLGLDLRAVERVPGAGFKNGRNRTARLDYETVAVFDKP